MELFSLLAKLTLDSTEFEKGLDKAEQSVDGLDIPNQKLGLDTQDFERGVEDSEGLGKTFGSEMEGVFSGIKQALTVTGIVAAVTGIVNGLKEAVNLTAETADQIDKGSRRLGISTKAYQEWDHALRQSGAGINDLNKGIMVMQAAIKAADPATPFADAEDAVDGLADKTAGLSADAYEAFRELGMLGDLEAGKFSNAEDLMSATLKKLAAFTAEGGSTDDRGILVRKLFGRGGDSLNALLDSGTEGVEQLLKEASDLGLVMSQDEIDNAVKYGDAVANLNSELDAIKTAFVADIIPVLTDCVGWLTDFLTLLNPRLQTSSIYQVFDEIDQKATKASSQVDASSASAKKLIEDLQAMGDYWTLDEQGRMTWDALAAKALELFPQLSQYIDTDGKKISGNTLAIEQNIDAWARLEKQRLLSNAMAEKSQKVADQLTAAYEKGAEAAVKEADAEGKRQAAIDALQDVLNKNGQLREAVEGLFGTSKITGENADDILYWYQHENKLFTAGGEEEVAAYNNTKEAAAAMRAESEKMIAEAEQAQADLTTYEKKLAEQMGLTQAEVIAGKERIDELKAAIDSLPSDVYTRYHVTEDDYTGHAIGADYIPYDNYPALLHRGEKVLTAKEARQQNSQGVNMEHLEERIAAAIRSGMQGVTVESFIDGKRMTDDSNRRNMRDIKARRYRG